jgi:hypothetical protein
MDPNANLAEQSELCDLITGIDVGRRDCPDSDLALWRESRARLTELREALTDWLRMGGFAPDWTRERLTSSRYQMWRRRNGLQDVPMVLGPNL